MAVMTVVDTIFENMKARMKDLGFQYTALPFKMVPDNVKHKSFYIDFVSDTVDSALSNRTYDLRDRVIIYVAWRIRTLEDIKECKNYCDDVKTDMVDGGNSDSGLYGIIYAGSTSDDEFNENYRINEINFDVKRRL